MKMFKVLPLLAVFLALATATPAVQQEDEPEEKPAAARRDTERRSGYNPGGSSYCPVDYCTINTSNDPYYNYAYVRSNPCNNKAPIMTLYDGDSVYDLGVPFKYGCGYYYKQVLITSGSSNKVGWVGAQFLNCNGGNYPAPAAAAMAAPGQGKYS